jgi:hypothetical protein
VAIPVSGVKGVVADVTMASGDVEQPKVKIVTNTILVNASLIRLEFLDPEPTVQATLAQQMAQHYSNILGMLLRSYMSLARTR